MSTERVFEIRAWRDEGTATPDGTAERTVTHRAPRFTDPTDEDTEKREAVRILHRHMRELGEGARGTVRLEGFGFVVQQRLERDPKSGRLEFVTEEL